MAKGFQPFKDRLTFLEAIRETLKKYLKSSPRANKWFVKVSENYSKVSQ